jgi:hypothetical protein
LKRQNHKALIRRSSTNEIGKGLGEMLTQDQSNEEGEEGRAGEAARGGDEEDDDDEEDDHEDEEEAYESPKDPFPREARRRPMEEELDKDFDPNTEVGIKP